MLPGNIDLTANRDFGSQGPRIIQMDHRIELIDNDYMSLKDYEAIVEWEKFFGQRYHRNQKRIVFDTEKKYVNRWNGICCRCGTEIRVPWKNHGGVCVDCDNYLEHPYIPWKHAQVQMDRSNMIIRNLFSAR